MTPSERDREMALPDRGPLGRIGDQLESHIAHQMSEQERWAIDCALINACELGKVEVAPAERSDERRLILAIVDEVCPEIFSAAVHAALDNRDWAKGLDDDFIYDEDIATALALARLEGAQAMQAAALKAIAALPDRPELAVSTLSPEQVVQGKDGE